MYAKIFSSLWDGSLRGKSDPILVFVNLLTHCDQDGFVDRHFRAIADETGLGEERVRAAISELEAPDNHSRSPELEGRRIERMDEHRDWGWRIVNYAHYRQINKEAVRREQNRSRVQRWRDKKKTVETPPSPTPPTTRDIIRRSISRSNVTVTGVMVGNAVNKSVDVNNVNQQRTAKAHRPVVGRSAPGTPEVPTEEFQNAKMNGWGKRMVELMDSVKSVLGEDEFKNEHQRWYHRAETEPDKLSEILSEVSMMRTQGEIKTTEAKTAEYLWGNEK